VQNNISSLISWFKWLALGCALTVIVVLLVSWGLYTSERDDDKEQAALVDQQRVERSIESCKAYNVDQSRNRTFSLELIPTMASSFFDETPAEIEELKASEGFAAYEQFVAKSYPYRECSRVCVDAYLSSALEDCPASADPE
jgi:hypothetical protein